MGQQLEGGPLGYQPQGAIALHDHAHAAPMGIKGQLAAAGLAPLQSLNAGVPGPSGQQHGRLGGIAKGPHGSTAAIQARVGAEARFSQQPSLIGRPGLGQPQGLHRHTVAGEGAGLVAADHTHRAQGFHRRKPAHEGLLAGHTLHVDGQGQGDGGQQALGHVGHDDPNRKNQAFHGAHPHKQQAEAEGDGPHRQGDGGDGAHDVPHLLLQGADAAGGGSGEVGDVAKLGFGAGGIDDGLGAPTGHGGARQNQVGPLTGGDDGRLARLPDSNRIGMARHRQGFTGEHRQVEAELNGRDQAGIGRHLIPLLQQDPITGHQQLSGELDGQAIAPEPHLARQGALEGLEGALGLVVLPEGKQAVDQHHRPDGPAELGGTRRKCQGAGHPEQQGHEVHQLVNEAQQQGTAAQAGQAVGAEPLEAPLGLPLAQALGRGLQRRRHRGGGKAPDRLAGREQHGTRGNADSFIMNRPGPGDWEADQFN